MGIGLVDPILPAIAQSLEATPTQTELLFTSYLLVTGPRDARHELRVEPHRGEADAPHRPRRSSWSSRPRPASRRTSSRSSASAPAGGSATRSSSPPRWPRSWAPRRAASGVGDHPVRGGARPRHRDRPAPRRPARPPQLARPVLRHRGAHGGRRHRDPRVPEGRRPSGCRDPAGAHAAVRTAPRAAPTGPRGPRRRRPVLQHRLLRAARVLAVPARVRRDGPRPHVLRLGRRARDHVGLRRPPPDRTDAAHPRPVDRAAAPGRSTSPRPAS